ncbi:hypothetical protein ASPNIDRAFT_51773 [Aspergillus niger ATCC 1015]|uniref:Glucanase n=1 Tax=Aspergillus niger (strain ATCC 1015 / CBS 113.46 / FGSC A1144 / LSHB Ac4 / NCTC 3858a / NRRL 328 / USDA 3528.7) TaxID=380704 RepID=G3XQZ3_ASPNA|nr:hypothetical protein ASPNIDRAFT_51773 [Aspergillus niger ATCC 1015]
MSSFQIYRAALLLSILATANAQQVGTYTTETHPSLTWQTCTSDGSCTTNDGEVVIDANWRWVHSTSSATNCYTGNEWDTSICTDDVTCAANCALDGATYEATYGVTTSGSELRLNFVTQGSSKNIGSRLYLMSDDSNYELFKLLGGTGYCDSQCPRDLKFINGEANCDGWEPSSNNVNTGVGDHGSCCAEMDVWEANSISNAFTAHPCDSVSQTMCDGDSCGGTYSASGDRYSGTCDPDGCDYNPYRLGNTDFYGPGLTVDTNSPFTVVTQFITDDGTSSGTLTEIKRLYVQNGEVIANGASTYSSVNGSSITSAFCESEKTLFGDENVFDKHGGLEGMGEAMAKGMVLVLSLWDDYAADMLWLDSDYPVNSSASTPGVARGTCSTDSGVPATVEAESPNAYVTYSNIKFGPIGSTYSSGSSSGSGSSSSSSSTTTKATSTTLKTTSTTSSGSSSTSAAQAYGQCGGQGWTGPTTCVSGYTCTYENAYYSQCL